MEGLEQQSLQLPIRLALLCLPEQAAKVFADVSVALGPHLDFDELPQRFRQ